MSVTMVALEGRESKSKTEVDENGKPVRAEAPMKFTALNLKASDYPQFPSVSITVKKVKTEVAQVPVLPSLIVAPHFDSYEDVVASAGTDYRPSVVRWANDAAESAARSDVSHTVRSLRVFSSVADIVKGVGERVLANMFKTPEKKGRVSTAAAGLKIVETMPGDSVEDKLARLAALEAYLRSKA